MTAPLVDVGAGGAADFTGKDVKGAVVLGRRRPRAAVAAGGQGSRRGRRHLDGDRALHPPGRSRRRSRRRAAGRPPVGQRPLRRKPEGASGSRPAGARRHGCASGCERVRSACGSTSSPAFYDGPNRIARRRDSGHASKPDERIVMVAHIQEPGANDDASGCATLYGAGAGAAPRRSRAARCRAPARTLTFMWVDEIRGSRAVAGDRTRARRRACSTCSRWT